MVLVPITPALVLVLVPVMPVLVLVPVTPALVLVLVLRRRSRGCLSRCHRLLRG